jgi:hypothetical protein
MRSHLFHRTCVMCLFILAGVTTPAFAADPLSPKSEFSFLGAGDTTNLVLFAAPIAVLIADPAQTSVGVEGEDVWCSSGGAGEPTVCSVIGDVVGAEECSVFGNVGGQCSTKGGGNTFRCSAKGGGSITKKCSVFGQGEQRCSVVVNPGAAAKCSVTHDQYTTANKCSVFSDDGYCSVFRDHVDSAAQCTMFKSPGGASTGDCSAQGSAGESQCSSMNADGTGWVGPGADGICKGTDEPPVPPEETW